MLAIIAILLAAPVAAALVSLRAPLAVAQAATATGALCFALVLALVPAASHHDLGYLSYLRIDAVSVVFLLATSFLYAAVAVYSVGYLPRDSRSPGFTRYYRRFYAGLNLFAWSLLATIFAYYAGAQVLGEHYNLAFGPLLHAGARLPHAPVRLAFGLAVLGFGTKMGLFPVHTWLPDAHSEAPTPVSALLSGSLLAVSFYAILRYYQVAVAALGPRFPRDVLLVFGVASLLLAALYLLDQRDYKRLLAYSSVEHMGILAIGVSFGAPIALAGVLLHVLAHAAAKGNAFMGAGVLVRKFGSKRISAVRGGLDLLPWSGPLFLLAVFALSAMPPFGIFRSEFEIVQGGFAASSDAGAAVLIVLVTLAFLGLSAAANRMLFMPADADAAARYSRGEPSAWMVVPVAAGIVVLLVLGVHPPAELTGLLTRAAALLGRVA